MLYFGQYTLPIHMDVVIEEDEVGNLNGRGLGVGVDLNGKRHRTLVSLDLEEFDLGIFWK